MNIGISPSTWILTGLVLMACLGNPLGYIIGGIIIGYGVIAITAAVYG